MAKLSDRLIRIIQEDVEVTKERFDGRILELTMDPEIRDMRYSDVIELFDMINEVQHNLKVIEDYLEE